MDIEGKVFIVTGGASGLGGATATMLVQAGGKVVIADVDADAAAGRIRDLGENARFVRCDVASEDDGKAVVAEALKLGPVRGHGFIVLVHGTLAKQRLVGAARARLHGKHHQARRAEIAAAVQREDRRDQALAGGPRLEALVRDDRQAAGVQNALNLLAGGPVPAALLPGCLVMARVTAGY